MKKCYTTRQAAAQIGVNPQTLYKWIESGTVRAPQWIMTGGSSHRLFWSDADIARARKAKGIRKIRRPRKNGKK